MATIESLRGRLTDCDAHLQLSPAQFEAAMGAEFSKTYEQLENRRLGMDMIRSAVASSDSVVLDKDNVWTLKGWSSPAAFDAGARLEALDLMGIDRQILFPIAFFAAIAVSRMPGAADAASRYNDFVLDWASDAKGRLRPVAMLPMLDVEEALAEARRTIDKGAYAVNISCGHPPAGLSPADPAWDPLWAMLAEANVPALLHVGSEAGFFDKAWAKIPSLQANALPGGGEALGPFSLATFHYAAQLYITSLILGGVFERHPNLRFGAIELTAQWVGPMAEMLDQRVDVFARRMSKLLSKKPSEYLSSQVRVTPFWWEPVDVYIERYGLEDVYVFSTDFPHPEGGKEPVQRLFDRVSPLGEELTEKFFVTNGDLLLPVQ